MLILTGKAFLRDYLSGVRVQVVIYGVILQTIQVYSFDRMKN